MTKIYSLAYAILLGGLCISSANAQSVCPARPGPATVINNPFDVFSSGGVLNASFTMKSVLLGFLEECYIYQSPTGAVEAPTLRLNPGDQLILNLTDRLTYLPPPPPGPQRPGAAASMQMANMPGMATPGGTRNPCNGGTMVATSTNIHFHGLNIPPKCHQDEIINTVIQNTDSAFEYNFQVPLNDSPGMYWYHPHVHGTATLQLNGGAAGALIVQGMEKVKPQVAGLPERVFIIRQQFTNPNSWIAGPYQLTLNYAPAAFPTFPSPTIQMQPGAKEFWRVANASTQGFMALQVRFGETPQNLEIIALDGIPVKTTTNLTTINLPPAGRVEFIVQGPAAGQSASFWQNGFDSGPIGNPNFPQLLANMVPTAQAKEPPSMPAAPTKAEAPIPQRFAGLQNLTPTATRNLYFAEATNGSNGPTQFLIVVEGQIPKVFSMSDAPAIVTTVGAVEDWTIENRTGETHAFHIHQIHFLFLATSGVANPDPELQDTVIVPAWNGTGKFPNVKLRMDFRDPDIAGTFVYHCHVLDHEDAGMMAKIQVNPK
jgi:FtsP/CotA-like multicopper oxidase with cupredoxin domain